MKVKLLFALISLLLIRFVGSSQTNGNPHPLSSPNSVLEVAPKPFIDGTTKKWGLKTDDGKIVIKAKYDFAFPMSEDLVPVMLNNKMGYIDRNEKVVIPFIYTDAWPFEKGLARVVLGLKMGFVDKEGKQVIPINYDWVDYFFTDSKIKVRNDNRVFYIDRNGKEVKDSLDKGSKN